MPRIPKNELLFLQEALKTDKAMGKKLGITGEAVRQSRKIYGIPRLHFKRVPVQPDITKNELLRLQKKFVTDPAIGEKLGIHDYKVRLIRNYYGIPAILRDNTKRNEKIVALYKKGMIGRVIAKKFGLTTIYVYTIIRYAGAGKRKAARNQPR